MIDNDGNLDVTFLLVLLFGVVFALYIGAVAFGVFSNAVIPQDVYGNGTVYQGGISMGSNELNSSMNNVDNMAASGMSLAGNIPIIIVLIAVLIVIGVITFK